MELNKRNMKLLQLCMVLGLLFSFSSCRDKDDYKFDYEYAKELYEKTFPVQNIDPNQDWKTTNVTTLNVSVNWDEGETYRIRVLTDNPLSANDVKLLGQGNIVNGQILSFKIDTPVDLQYLFVACSNSKNRMLIQQIELTSNELTVVFGNESATRAAEESEAVNPDKHRIPDWTSLLKVDLATIRSKSQPLDNNVAATKLKSGYYCIKAGEVLNRKVEMEWDATEGIILVDGQWTVNDEVMIKDGWTVIVTGELEINKEMSYQADQGGKPHPLLIIDTTGKLYVNNANLLIPASNNNKNKIDVYNAGIMNTQNGTLTLGGVLYNAHRLFAGKVVKGNNGWIIYNYGSIKATDMKGWNNTIYNFCYTNIVEAELSTLNLGPSSRSDFEMLAMRADNQADINLGDKAMVNIGNFVTNGISVKGPSNLDKGFGILKMETVEVHGDGNKFLQSVYVDWDGKCEGREDNKDLFVRTIKNWVHEDNTFLMIPKGECTGDGYRDDEEDDEVKDIVSDNIVYTFCYEDYYPKPGDYDFNDVVMDMTYEVERSNNGKVKKIDLEVTLVAVGANYQLGAALQLIGVHNNDIEKVEVEGGDLTAGNVLFTSMEEENQSQNANVVIPLFNDAHYLLSGQNQNRNMYNTARGHSNYQDAKPVTVTIEVSLKNSSVKDITLDNLDLFIARPIISGYYEGQEGKTRVEIHLYEFWNNKTLKSVEFAANEAAAGNRTWALCVPDFKYPYETVPIYKIEGAETSEESAYPNFQKWASNRSEAQDWYKHPNEQNVYR